MMKVAIGDFWYYDPYMATATRRTKLVGIGGYKGGTGKSMLAFNLAERALSAGLRVLLWDLENRLHYVNRTLTRRQSQPELPCWDLRRQPIGPDAVDFLQDPALNVYDLVICDFPGLYDSSMNPIFSALDLLLVPVSATDADFTALAPMGEDALYLPARQTGGPRRRRSAPWSLVFIASNMFRGRSWLDELRIPLLERGYEVAEPVIHRRVDVVKAGIRGLGTCEYAPDSARPPRLRRSGAGSSDA